MLSNIEDAGVRKYLVGYTIIDRRVVCERDVMDFAKLSGDYNPIHVDDLFASNSIFKKRIAHGMFVASFFSKLLGDKKYGYSGIYLNQNLKFLKPVYINETVDIIIELTHYNKIRSIMTFKTICKVNENIVIDGNADIFIK